MALPLKRRFAFDSRPERMLWIAGEHMRIRSDVRKSVVFLGYLAKNKFEAVGTAFFLMHDNMPYLITARHVAEQLGDDPFFYRLNSMEGDALTCHCDPLEWTENHMQWFFHDDPNVDLAALPWAVNLQAVGADFVVLSTQEIIVQDKPPSVDTGDICHVVGLFSVHPGQGRITPVIHTGNIAMMPDPSEPIPTEAPNGQTLEIEGYLVEVSNLQGLSGSPVLIRPTIAMQLNQGEGMVTGGLLGGPRVYLLGVWQGSWEGKSAIGGVGQKRVPIGMGVVTPIEKLVELLEAPDCVSNRDLWRGIFRSVIDA
jgi:hypothetical protein